MISPSASTAVLGNLATKNWLPRMRSGWTVLHLTHELVTTGHSLSLSSARTKNEFVARFPQAYSVMFPAPIAHALCIDCVMYVLTSKNILYIIMASIFLSCRSPIPPVHSSAFLSEQFHWSVRCHRSALPSQDIRYRSFHFRPK